MGKFFNFLAGVAETAVKVTTGKDLDLNNDGKNGVQIGTGYYKSWEKDADGKFIAPKPEIENAKKPNKGNGNNAPNKAKGGGNSKPSSKDGSDDEDSGFMDMLMKPIMGIPLIALAIGGYLILPKLMGGTTARRPRRRTRRKR